MAQWWKEAGVADVANEGTDIVATVREVVAEVRSAVRPIEEAAAAAPTPGPSPNFGGGESLPPSPPGLGGGEGGHLLQRQSLVGRVAELEKQMRELQATLARLETERVAALSG